MGQIGEKGPLVSIGDGTRFVVPKGTKNGELLLFVNDTWLPCFPKYYDNNQGSAKVRIYEVVTKPVTPPQSQ